MLVRQLRRFVCAGGRNTLKYSTKSTEPHIPEYVTAARVLAGLFIVSAGVQVLPFAATALVDHTIRLIQTDQRFLQDAGITRLYYLVLLSRPAREKAIELGALKVLLSEGQVDAFLEKRLAILQLLSSSPQFKEQVSCPSLRRLLYALEELQLDSDGTGDQSMDALQKVSINYGGTKNMYRQFCVTGGGQ
jgi:hypothetical protein